MRYLTLLFLFFVFHETSYGQYYETGQDPASLKWVQIKTPRFRIIYPESYGRAGIDYARSIIKAEQEIRAIFPGTRFRIPVVIHNYSTYSNAYVAWAPKRIEIYPAAEQNALPGDQFRLLSLHELTHVYQMKSLETGFTKGLSVLLGEQVTGAVSALLPLWYLEGGAVMAESALTYSGRGRSAWFQKQFRAIALERPESYGYDKVLNGSYRDFVPDHYESGYQMVTWAMTRYDTAIWNKVLKFTGKYPFTVNPVNLELRRYDGLTKKKLYYESFNGLKARWQDDLQDSRSYEHLNPPKNERYVSYHSPLLAGDDQILAIKTSLSSSPAIVSFNPATGREKVLFKPGNVFPYLVSYGGGNVVWVEKRPDPRWENRDFSVIRVLDTAQGRARRISYRSRYLAASVSRDGRFIAAVENTPDNRNNLVVIETATGKVIKSVATPSNLYIQKPAWSDDGSKITVLYLADNGEGIMVYSPADNTWDTLVEAGWNDLQSAFLRNDSLFYVSSRSGTENLYLQAPSGTLQQVTRSRFGAVNPDFSGSRIVFSDYSSGGNSIGITSLDQSSAVIAPPDTGSFIINRLDLKGKIDPEEPEQLQPVRYRKIANLFRFHSWMPFYADLEAIQSDPLSIRPGVTLMSQNILSTLVATLGYEYSASLKHELHSRVTWQGQYPVVSATLDYGYLRNTYGQQVPPGLRFNTEISIPFRFSTGYFSQYLRPSIEAEYTNYLRPTGQNRYDYEQTSFTGRLYFSNYARIAHRDIYPRFAQTFDLNYMFTPFDSEITGYTAYIKTAFFLPGLFRDHGIRVRLEGEIQDPAMYVYPNRISFPRGFDDIASPGGFGNIISNKLWLATADYVFPVAYPDLNLASLLYLKRIRAGLFYDFARGRGNRYLTVTENGSGQTFSEGPENFYSYGLELLTDFHLLRIPFEISGGVRAAWMYPEDPPNISLVFNIDLYGFSPGRNNR